jgi:hypothetical protein
MKEGFLAPLGMAKLSFSAVFLCVVCVEILLFGAIRVDPRASVVSN